MGAESSRAIIECKKSDGTILDVHGQRLLEVDKKLLVKFPGLLQLNLSDNELKFLPADISRLQKLEKLVCVDNELTDLPSFLPALKELDLSSNRLRNFPHDYLQHSLLRVLRLASNQIVELPPLRLPKLVSLSLANNALPLLPASTLATLSSLTNLNVERNQFSFWPLPKGVAMHALQYLNVSYNGVTLLPDSFTESFRELTELRLAATQIDVLPASVSRLTRLTALDVSGNSLQTIRPVCALLNLEKLQLSGNRIASLEGIGALASLNRLEAGANKLAALPLEMTALRLLEVLYVESNTITALPAALCMALPRLVQLQLQHNALTELPDDVSRLTCLEVLDVSHNKVAQLKDVIVTMPSLQTLKYDGKPPHLQQAPSRKLLRSTSTQAMMAISKGAADPGTSPSGDMAHARQRVTTNSIPDKAREKAQTQVQPQTQQPIISLSSPPAPLQDSESRHHKRREKSAKRFSGSVVSSSAASAAPAPTVPALVISSAPNVSSNNLPIDDGSSSFIVRPRFDVNASGDGNGAKQRNALKGSGLNFSATVANLNAANPGDVRRLRVYLAEGKNAWLEEFRAADGLEKLVALVEQSVGDDSGKRTAVLAETLECLRVWPIERVTEIVAIPRSFAVLCQCLEPPADDTTAAAVPRVQLFALRLLADMTKAASNTQPLLDGLDGLQERQKLDSRFQVLARLLGSGDAALGAAGLALINALLSSPDEVEQRSRLRAEIEGAGVKPLMAKWRTQNDSSLRLQLRNYAEAVEFDETTMSSSRGPPHASPREDTQLRVLLVPLQKAINLMLDKELTLGVIRQKAAEHGLSSAEEYSLFLPETSTWLREDSSLVSTAATGTRRAELRLPPWSFRLSVPAAQGAPTDTVVDLDPHLTCAQILASLLRRFSLPSDTEYELLYTEESARTPLDPTETLVRYKALRKRDGKLLLKKLRKDLRVELPQTVRGSGNHVRRVSGAVSLKEELASLATQGFLPTSEVALWRESSGDWINAEALDDLEASDVLRLTAKPLEVQIAVPPTGKKVSLNVSLTEEPRAVINRLVARVFNRDQSLASSLVLFDVTLGMAFSDGKSLREQGYEASHDLVAMEREKSADSPKPAGRVLSSLLDEPALILNPPAPNEISFKGTELQAATLNALLHHLTEDPATAAHEGPAFLLCFRSLCTASAVVARLLERYRAVATGAPGAVEKARVRNAVAALVVEWVESYPEDFDEQALLKALTELYRMAERDPASPEATAQLQEACAIATTGSKHSRRQAHRTPLQGADLAAKAAKMHAQSAASIVPRLLDSDSGEVAWQLTRLDSADYRRIRSLELLQHVWNSEKRDKESPHLSALVTRFNYIAGLVTETLLLQQKLRHRVKAMSFVIKVAVALHEMRNYWSLMAVISGLSHSAITRLRWTLKKLPSSAAQDLAQLRVLMNPSDNWRPYRAEIAASHPPCVPYLGVYFQDIVFITDGNPDKIRQPSQPSLINFSKHRQLYGAVSALRKFQAGQPYDIEEDDEITALVSVPLTLLSEEQLHAMSLEREPRNADISDIM